MREGVLLKKGGEANALQALQNKIRSPIATANTGTDEPDAGNIVKILNGIPVAPFGVEEGDAKHPVFVERVFEHCTIALLKNVEWQESVRKEQRTRQRHDGNGGGQRYGIGHWTRAYALIYIRSPARPGWRR